LAERRKAAIARAANSRSADGSAARARKHARTSDVSGCGLPCTVFGVDIDQPAGTSIEQPRTVIRHAARPLSVPQANSVFSENIFQGRNVEHCLSEQLLNRWFSSRVSSAAARPTWVAELPRI
jgi:hypothetical protein